MYGWMHPCKCEIAKVLWPVCACSRMTFEFREDSLAEQGRSTVVFRPIGWSLVAYFAVGYLDSWGSN